MTKKISATLLLLLILLVAYLLFYPVPVDPKPWQAAKNPGYSGDYASNDILSQLEIIDIGKDTGPEDIAMDEHGNIYVSTHEGNILRINPKNLNIELFASIGGRPLGLAFDHASNLIVADAYDGLMKIDPNGKKSQLLSEVDGVPLEYSNNLDIASDGTIYFSDASSKFGAKANGGSYPASLLDLMEHGGHGRVFSFNPETGKVTTLVSGLTFANGIALAHDESALYINETGEYRIHKHWLKGTKKGQTEVLIDALPSFPDNMTRGQDGRYWVGLVSPRSPLVDKLSDKPFVRKIIQRMPAFIRPKATHYSHVIAFDDNGNIVANLQDPSGAYPTNTSVLETDKYIYIGSLTAKDFARLDKLTLNSMSNDG